MPQLRVCMLQIKFPHAATKTHKVKSINIKKKYRLVQASVLPVSFYDLPPPLQVSEGTGRNCQMVSRSIYDFTFFVVFRGWGWGVVS